LTPLGFAQWIAIHTLAYPEEELKRFEIVVLNMPIDADGEMVDGKPERLPKQISRHLLPEREDRKSKELLDDAINNFFEDLGLSSRRKASIVSSSLS
jgi:fatty acid-binding protein DegV